MPLKLFAAVLVTFLVFSSCERQETLEDGFAKAADSEKWEFIWVPDMKCRDNSATGIGVRLKANSKKLLIYLEGGGGCFNTLTCAANPSAFGAVNFEGWKLSGLQSGIFTKGNEDNPFKDWNWVYVPYCTGDVHSGSNYGAYIDDLYKDQKMAGFDNMRLALDALKNHFNGQVDEVFLTGSSAGGYGALFNANQVIEAFPNATTTVLDDSGPVHLDQQVQPDCLDQLWDGIFNMQIPTDFATYTSGQQPTEVKAMYEYLSTKHPNVQFGLISALEDLVIREFYGYGKDNCASSTVVPAPVSASAYKNSLLYLRDSVFSQHTNWKTFYVNDASHTFNLLPGILKKEVNGTTFLDWINALRNRTATHVSE